MIFVDSGAWIAFSNQTDQHHKDALAIYNGLKKEKAQLLTTDYIIDETTTWLRYRASHPAAIKFLDHIERAEGTDVLTVVAVDKTLFQEAKRLFRQYDSANLSFTDCTSFAVCQAHKLSEAFAFDQHFTMENITLLG